MSNTSISNYVSAQSFNQPLNILSLSRLGLSEPLLPQTLNSKIIEILNGVQGSRFRGLGLLIVAAWMLAAATCQR